METTKEYLFAAHTNDLVWKNDLEFYQAEIKILRKRLEEISAKNSSKEIKMLVSHFENQFIINEELIDELLHDINKRESLFTEELKKNATAYEHRLTTHYAVLNGKVIIFKKLFAELRNAFNRFSSETM